MIYLDHAATTPCAPEVVEAMLPFFRDNFANASSIDHLLGNAAQRAVDTARESVAELLGARPTDVIFTSGSTEANNIALSVKHRVVTTRIEHPSILESFFARSNPEDKLLDVDQNGLVEIESLRQHLHTYQSPTLVSIIATNNETATEQDVELLARMTAEYGAILHMDATQAVGTRAFDLDRTGISGVSLSAHKIGGPKGVGALVARTKLRKTMSPIMYGGGHERGFRPGTLNVPAIVGFATAARLLSKTHNDRRKRLTFLRSIFLEALIEQLGGDIVSETILARHASPHILSLRLRGINGRALLGQVRNEVAFSLGSACATMKSEPSHVLVALGLQKRTIAETIRISLSAEQSLDQIARASHIIAEAAKTLISYSLSA